MENQNLKSKIDWHVICRTRELRMAKNVTPEIIAVYLDVSKEFIEHVESPGYVAAYTPDQLNILARLLKCSPKDFWPDKPV